MTKLCLLIKSSPNFTPRLLRSNKSQFSLLQSLSANFLLPSLKLNLRPTSIQSPKRSSSQYFKTAQRKLPQHQKFCRSHNKINLSPKSTKSPKRWQKSNPLSSPRNDTKNRSSNVSAKSLKLSKKGNKSSSLWKNAKLKNSQPFNRPQKR